MVYPTNTKLLGTSRRVHILDFLYDNRGLTTHFWGK